MLLLSLRVETMAENLLAVVTREWHRGPSLVFAHNVHLQRAQSGLSVGDDEVNWCGAGALVGLELGKRYLVVATDGSPHGDPGTFQGLLAEATTRRSLFPAPALRAALPASVRADEPIVRGHIPLTPEDVDRVDAAVFSRKRGRRREVR